MTAVSFLDIIYLVKSETRIWIHSLPMKIGPLHHHCYWKEIRPSANSDLLHCLELCEKQLLQAPNVDAIILDGTAVVHMLHPGMARTFQDYADTVLVCMHCLSYRMPIKLTLFGICKWKTV